LKELKDSIDSTLRNLYVTCTRHRAVIEQEVNCITIYVLVSHNVYRADRQEKNMNN